MSISTRDTESSVDETPEPAVGATGEPQSLLDRIRELRATPKVGLLFDVVVGYVVLVEIVLQVVFGRIDIPFVSIGFLELGFGDRAIPREIFLGGAVIGSLYALVGMGLIVVHRANRIINFAQAQLGAIPAVAALLLITNKGWNYFLVLPVVLGGAVLLGAAVEKGPISRLRNAPRLILTVATIGIGFVLLVLEFFTKAWLAEDVIESSLTEFPTPWTAYSFSIGTQIFNGNHVVAVIAVAVIVAAIGAFFKYTDMGIAVRASAENADRASLLGIPVKRVSTVVWVLAAVLSAVGVFLRAPLVGVPLTGFVGPAVLLFGLAAAVMAKMDNLPMCLAGGMFIGCVDQTAVFATGQGSLATAAMLAVILVALLAQRGTLSRAYDTGVSSFQATREVRPIPAELRDLPEIKRMKVLVGIVVAVIALTAPFVVGAAQVGLVTQLVLFAMVGVSLVILTGWAGQISLGQWAFAGVGAVVAGGLVTRNEIDFFLVLFLGGAAAAVIAVLVGIPALRIQGLFLAVTTLAFAAFVEGFLLRRDDFGWLMPPEGAFVERPLLYGVLDIDAESSIGPITVSGDIKFFYLCLAFLALTMLIASSVRTNRSGRVFLGLRDNQRAAQAFGIDPARTKLATFALSGFIAGLAGGLFAFQARGVEPDLFASETSILMFVMAVIGGIGTIPGALLGAAFVKGIPLLPVLRDIDLIDLLASGAGLLVLLLFMPGGLAEGMYRIRDDYLRALADRKGIFVPSLVADSLDAQQARDGADDDTGAATPSAPVVRPEGDPILVCRGVEVAYDQVQVLFGVDLEVHAGEIVALLGTNGAGKSTVLKAVSGIVKPKAGTVLLEDVDITDADAVETTKAGIVQVPGGKAVFPTLTVAEHLRAAGWLYRDDPERLAQANEDVLETFPRLRERIDQLAGNLSGGEQQMLALGMAFIAKPKVLVIDELSLGLAPTIVEQLLEIVRDIQRQGTAIILVEQSINVALTVAQRAYFMEKGEVRFEGPTADLLGRDDIVRSVFLAGHADAPNDGPPHEPGDAADGEQSTVPTLLSNSAPMQPGSTVLLEVDDVVKRFGGITAVDGTSFVLHEHEILGLIGANGAGKTTIFDLISGYLTPTSGTIRFKGEDVTSLPPQLRAWRGLGRSFQDARIFSSLTVAENIALGLERHLATRDHLAAALSLPGVRDQEVDIAWSVDDLIELMNLGAFRDKFVRELSTGSRRVVDLAMCIAHDPDVLLLDEPAAGIAQAETEQLGPLMHRIRREAGCAILVIEHDMPLITGVSDRMLCLEVGRTIAQGDPVDVIGDPRVVSSYLGGDMAVINRSGRDDSPGPVDEPIARRRRRAPLHAGGVS